MRLCRLLLWIFLVASIHALRHPGNDHHRHNGTTTMTPAAIEPKPEPLISSQNLTYPDNVNDGQFVTTSSVGWLLVVFICFISAFLLLACIAMFFIRYHYKFKADEMLAQLEAQHELDVARSNPSPFAVHPTNSKEPPILENKPSERVVWPASVMAGVVHNMVPALHISDSEVVGQPGEFKATDPSKVKVIGLPKTKKSKDQRPKKQRSPKQPE